jgi:hypothetical protein
MHRALLLLAIVALIAGGVFFVGLGGGDPQGLEAPGGLSLERTEPVEWGELAGAAPAAASRGLVISSRLMDATQPVPSERAVVGIPKQFVITVSVSTRAGKPFEAWLSSRAGNGTKRQPALGNVPFSIWLAGPSYGQRPLFEGVTGDDGKALIEIPMSSELHPGDQDRLDLMGRGGLGYQDGDQALVQPKGTSHYRLNLLLEPGGTLRGRVVDSSGEALLAKIWLLEENPASKSDNQERNGGTYTHGGEFKLNYTDRMHVGLFASAWAQGNAAIPSLFLDPAHPLPEQLLVIRGEGELRGVVLGADGEPYADLPLKIQLAAMDGGAGDSESLEPQATEFLREGLGRVAAELTTNAEGEFRGAGMRPGSYIVRVRAAGSDGGYPTIISPRPLLANGVPVVLRYDTPRLVLRLTDEFGGPWEGQVILSGGRPAQVELGAPRLVVVPCETPGGPRHAEGQFLRGKQTSPGVFEFDLYPGRDHLVGVVGAGFPCDFQVVKGSSGGE